MNTNPLATITEAEADEALRYFDTLPVIPQEPPSGPVTVHFEGVGPAKKSWTSLW